MSADEASVSAVPTEQSFWVEEVLTKLQYPWAMAWLPSGELLITERVGAIRVVRDGKITGSVKGVPKVLDATMWDGLFEIEVDPSFMQNRLVYLTYTDGETTARFGRVYRARLEDNELRDGQRHLHYLACRRDVPRHVPYGTIFTGTPRAPGHHSRNVCVFAEGEVDRSATGSGVSARAALHHAKGELAINQPIEIESILGSTMTVEVVGETKFGPHDAVIPEVSGTAHFTGRNEFWFDPSDILRTGFILR